MKTMKRVYVFVESIHQEITGLSLGVIQYAKKMAKEIKCPVYAILCEKESCMKPMAEQLLHNGADSVIWYKRLEEQNYFIDDLLDHMSSLIKKEEGMMLFPASQWANELAARMSIRLKVPLLSDCTEIHFDGTSQRVIFTRPSDREQKKLRYVCPDVGIPIATMKVLGEPMAEKEDISYDRIIKKCMNFEEHSQSLRLLSAKKKGKRTEDISKERILVAGGQGVNIKSDFETLQLLAALLGGALCVSRPVVDKGWYPKEIQVGLSGQKVRPQLYLAVGISGAFQHTVGIEEAKYVIAINIDRYAPIFDAADLGIVGDYKEIIYKLYKAVLGKNNSHKG